MKNSQLSLFFIFVIFLFLGLGLGMNFFGSVFGSQEIIDIDNEINLKEKNNKEELKKEIATQKIFKDWQKNPQEWKEKWHSRVKEWFNKKWKCLEKEFEKEIEEMKEDLKRINRIFLKKIWNFFKSLLLPEVEQKLEKIRNN